MIIVMKEGAAQSSILEVVNYVENNGLKVHLSQGEQVTV